MIDLSPYDPKPASSATMPSPAPAKSKAQLDAERQAAAGESWRAIADSMNAQSGRSAQPRSTTTHTPVADAELSRTPKQAGAVPWSKIIEAVNAGRA